jgi:uroporphyrinogen-III decarboxylase
MIDEKWTQLSPEEKREARFDRLLNPPNVKFESPSAEKNYKIRAQRLIDVYKVQEPDRLPVSISTGIIPAYLNGINGYTAMYNYDKAIAAWSKFNDEYAEKLDNFVSPGILPGPVYDLMDFKLYVWPGHGLPESAPSHQFVEGEYMRDDEYDHLIRDPSDFLMRVYLPRVFGVFAPYGTLPPLINLMELPHTFFLAYASPQMQETQRKLLKIGKEVSRWNKIIRKLSRRGMEMGFPALGWSTVTKAPFDTLGDTLRGTRGIMKDMYSQPDKLRQALDVIAEMTINSVITAANSSKGLLAFSPLHKGADGWMSPKQFETFYWASFKKVIDAVIKEGIIVSAFAEGGFNSRLETINVFPKGSVHWWFDQTDMASAKQILGDKCSIQGNVPVSLLVTGKPKEVKEYCRRLIEICGKGGGYILSAGAQADEAKMENLLAMAEAAREYGVYVK